MNFPTPRVPTPRVPTPRVLALIALLGAGCATATPPRNDAPPVPPPDRDAAGLAAWIDDLCDRDIDTRLACREGAVAEIAAVSGISAAMDVVARLGAGDSEGHVLTHMIGIRGFRGLDTVGESFSECTPIHQSGCYHGVIQAYFGALRQAGGHHDLDTGHLDGICEPYRGPDGDRWLLFQCLHGLGHGVMLVHDNHLPRALERCDLLSRTWDREVCYGGAFMENVMTVTSPHHDHVALAAHGGLDSPHDEHAGHHGDHAHHHAGTDSFKAIDPDDLHHPCSSVHSRYQLACYDMQTAAMLHILDGDIAATAAACRDAPERILRAICHRSLGRDINAITHGVHQESAALCALAAAEDRPSCHVGVVKNVIDVTADARSGLAYCAVVPEGREAEACNRAIGEQTISLMADPAERVRFCETLEPVSRRACLDGAGQAGRTRTSP